MTAKTWIRTPKSQVAILLTAYLLIASIGSHTWAGIRNGLVAVGVGVALDVLWCKYERRKRTVPDGSAITGLIIALILSASSAWWIAAAAAILALASKHLLVYRKKPVLNPASLGLLLSVLLFHSEQSWWGAFGDLPWWTAAFLLIGGYFIANKVRKFPAVFAFLGTYLTLLLILGLFHAGDAADALRPPFIEACLFFAFFMLTDPPTSPAKPKEQIVYGILAAVAGCAVYSLFGGLIYLFIGLLIANVYHLMISPAPAPAAARKPGDMRRASRG